MNQHNERQLPLLFAKTEILGLVSWIVFLAIFGSIFVFNTWERALSEKESAAIELAEAAQAGIASSHLEALSGLDSDVNKPEYQEIKSNLMYFVKLDNGIRFAYIMILREGDIYFAVDSEPADSPDYSPPGQKYHEADNASFRAFSSGETILTEPAKDRWGKWISVLVPMKNPDTGEVTAVFGVDYPAQGWTAGPMARAVQSAFVILCLLIIIIVLHLIARNNIELRREKQRLLLSEAKLKKSEALFRTIFDQTTIGIALVEGEKFIISAYDGHPCINPMYEKILGRSKESLEGISWKEITHPDDLKPDMEKFKEFKAGKIPGYNIEKRFIKPNGEVVWVNMIISSLYLGSSSDILHLCVIEDIGMRKAMESILYDSERSKSILLNNLPGMAYRCKCDRDWTMEFVSEGCYELTGYKPESIIDNLEKSYNDLILPEYQELLWHKWVDALQRNTKVTEEYQIVTASGAVKWVWEQGQGIYNDRGEVIALEGMILDITDRKNQEIKLHYVNTHDQLSGLYNRKYFEEMLNRELSVVSNGRRAVLLVNIRKFDLVNIAYGYAFGDSLIKEIASVLEKFMKADCVLCHISIDRFTLYVKNYESKESLDDLCTQVLDSLRSILAKRNIGARIGIVEIENYQGDADTIIKEASIAAGKVDVNESFGLKTYSAEMAREIWRESELKNELIQEVLSGGERRLHLLYQPIIDLKTGTITEFEALARFKSTRFGEISPLELIPLAEETQLIVPLGKIILRQVCEVLKRFQKEYSKPLFIALNVSAIQLMRDDFIADLKEVIQDTKVDPCKLGIELTESVFSDNYIDINAKLDAIKELGIKVSIDDFGTGYSSLAREGELNVDCLKIDKFFIDKLRHIGSEQSIISDIISMAHKLGHCVVAEGVEYQEQRDYLAAHSCDKIQGYLFSKPLPEEEALTLLLKES
jgi:PAS domain S-box-containing protein/diguanylate cyclase (GGDEF)-like protein